MEVERADHVAHPGPEPLQPQQAEPLVAPGILQGKAASKSGSKSASCSRCTVRTRYSTVLVPLPVEPDALHLLLLSSVDAGASRGHAAGLPVHADAGLRHPDDTGGTAVIDRTGSGSGSGSAGNKDAVNTSIHNNANANQCDQTFLNNMRKRFWKNAQKKRKP